MDTVNVLYFLFSIIVLILGGVVLMKLFVSLNKGKRIQREIMATASPLRQLTSSEIDLFNKLYKKKVPASNDLSVYKFTGTLTSTGFRSQGQEYYYFFTAGISLQQVGTTRLLPKFPLKSFLGNDAEHEYEIVFLKNNVNKPGFLIKFDEWTLADTEVTK